MKALNLSQFKKLHKKFMDIDDGIRQVLRENNTYSHLVMDSYPYIPYIYSENLYKIFRGMKTLWENPQFLDVGCGTGVIVKLAQEMGIEAQGIEFHKPYIDMGKEFFELKDEDLILADAFELKTDFLKKFNVIYTYMPVCNNTKMGELHLSLYSKACNGTFLVEMYPCYYPLRLIARNPENIRWVDTKSSMECPGFAVVEAWQ